MQPVKVYAVIGGTDYEGEDFRSLRLFDCFSTATAYLRHLEEEQGYDYSLLDTREVCLESALATERGYEDALVDTREVCLESALATA